MSQGLVPTTSMKMTSASFLVLPRELLKPSHGTPPAVTSGEEGIAGGNGGSATCTGSSFFIFAAGDASGSVSMGL